MAIAGMFLTSCQSIYVLKQALASPDELILIDQSSKYLKAHMKNGQVYVLEEWTVDDSKKVVIGTGKSFNVNRQSESEGPFTIPIDSVAIFETNRLEPSNAITSLTLVTVLSVMLSAACLPEKACFGSCPTFYVSAVDGKPLAEGFSASVAPSLESEDIDALRISVSGGDTIDILMTNEALETHVVRHVDLLAAPHDKGRSVFAATDGTFWQARNIIEPSGCMAPEGDCREGVSAFDGFERYSTADSTDLGSREIIEIHFDHVPDGKLGLVIASRQTLLTTYLFYQGLAYLGRSAGLGIAELERGGFKRMTHPLGETIGSLGGIEVWLQNEKGTWEMIADDRETGPIATDVRLIPLLVEQKDSLRVRLRMTRGLWRLDQIALASLDKVLKPVRLKPSRVFRDGIEIEQAKRLLLDPSNVLTTLPGDEYRLEFRLPENQGSYELFLESRGYYLEWMREAWLQEEDPTKLVQMLWDPVKSLRRLAPEYKRIEAEMDEIFWSSRYESH